MNTVEIILFFLLLMCLVDIVLLFRAFNHNMKAIEGQFEATQTVIEGLGNHIKTLNNKGEEHAKIMRDMAHWLSDMQKEISKNKTVI